MPFECPKDKAQPSRWQMLCSIANIQCGCWVGPPSDMSGANNSDEYRPKQASKPVNGQALKLKQSAVGLPLHALRFDVFHHADELHADEHGVLDVGERVPTCRTDDWLLHPQDRLPKMRPEPGDADSGAGSLPSFFLNENEIVELELKDGLCAPEMSPRSARHVGPGLLLSGMCESALPTQTELPKVPGGDRSISREPSSPGTSGLVTPASSSRPSPSEWEVENPCSERLRTGYPRCIESYRAQGHVL